MGPNMDWTKFQNADFSLEHPIGWQVRNSPGPVTTVSNPNGDVFALVEAIAVSGGDTPIIILEKLRYPTARLFPEARLEKVVAGPANSANVFLNYRMPTGIPGRARVACVPGGARATIFTTAAPEQLFPAYEPTLVRIVMSFRPASALPPPARPAAVGGAATGGPLTYTRITDAQMGTFTVETPTGWKSRAGLNHPMAGDRRTWVEVISPHGIYVLNGDPDLPQSFCHFPGNPDGIPMALAGGSTLLNMTPSADRIADYYLKHLAKTRFGAFAPLPRRQRPDVVESIRAQFASLGVIPAKGSKIWAVETPVQINQQGVQRVGSLLVTAVFTGQYAMGMFTFWGAGTFLYIAPPALAGQAEAVRSHLMQSYKDTPRMMQLVQQDEARITANGQAANAAQQNWFAGQQAYHQSQVAFGDAMVANYWNQQHANDAMMHGWEHTQAVNSQISQARSDQILDRQRLADDAMGNSYEAPSGFNHYWLDQQSGNIIGTDTSDPPDLSRNYTALRRL